MPPLTACGTSPQTSNASAPTENEEEVSHNGDVVWTLLMHLQSEYYQLKKADSILQTHRNQWMQYIEQWMLHQGQMLERMSLQCRKVEKTPTSHGSVDQTLGSRVEAPRHVTSRPAPAFEPRDTACLSARSDHHGQTMPKLPAASAQQPLGPDVIVAAFDNADVCAPLTSRVETAAPSNISLTIGREPTQESGQSASIITSNSSEKLQLLGRRERTDSTTGSEVKVTRFSMEGEDDDRDMHSYTDSTLVLPRLDFEDSYRTTSPGSGSAAFAALGEAVHPEYSRSASRDSSADAAHHKHSLSRKARQPAKHLDSRVLDPDDEFRAEVTRGSCLTSTIFPEGFNSESRDLTPIQQRWEELVVSALEAAQKELRSLRKCWIQREQFLQKAFKTSGQPTGALTMFGTGSQVASRKTSMISSRTRLSTALANKLLGSGLLERGLTTFTGEVSSWSCRDCTCDPIMNPTSPKRLCWVFVGMGLMFYDLVVFPMAVFNPPTTGFTTFMKYFSQIYWTLDIGVSFCTGFNRNGDLVLDPVQIARSYARTWLMFDCLVTLPLWIIIFLGWDTDNGTSIRSIRYFRMLRFLRLMRLAKLEHLLGEVLEFVNSSIVILSFGIVKLMVYLMLLNHFNACLWYAVGSTENGWADEETGHVAGRELSYKYFCAVHWSLTQFQGTSEVVPGTTLSERVYAAVFLLFALMILASFVSSLTNMMMQLQSLKDERNRQQRAIRSYLSTHKISRGLSMRVKKYVEWKLQMLSGQKSDDDVLKILPKLLVVELLYEVRGPVITQHKFFWGLDTEFARTFRRICHEAVQLVWQAPSELIFTAVDEAAHMYFITHGILRYRVITKKRDKSRDTMASNRSTAVKKQRSTKKKQSMAHFDSEVDDELETAFNVHEVSKGNLMCEAALWVDWDHCGELRTITDTAVLALESKIFSNVIALTPPAHASSVLYARRFLAALNRFGKNYTDILPEGGIVTFDREEQHVFTLESAGGTREF